VPVQATTLTGVTPGNPGLLRAFHLKLTVAGLEDVYQLFKGLVSFQVKDTVFAVGIGIPRPCFQLYIISCGVVTLGSSLVVS
jgi:hypothetical protein